MDKSFLFMFQNSLTFHFVRTVEDVLACIFDGGDGNFPFVLDTEKIKELNSKL